MDKKYQLGQKVDLIILRETDLGFVARVNDADEGLLYHNEIFEHLEVGQKLPGYVKKLREDGKIDLLLQPFGNFGTDEISERILQQLESNNGFLAITDKSDPQLIYDLFGVSKKKFKMALGGLYKKRMIVLEPSGFRLKKLNYFLT